MKLLVRLFLVCFGLAFVLVGALIWLNLGDAARANADRAAGLAPLAAADLAGQPGGTLVLVEGTLGPENPARFRDFVAYMREEFRGADTNGDDKWELDEVVLPPLVVDAGGPVRIVNEGYAMVGIHGVWQEEGLNWSSRTEEGTKRYAGLIAGGQVMVIGQVADATGPGGLVAELVYGGTRAAYIAEQRGRASALPWVGLAVALGGVGIALFGAWGLRRWR